jgi:hypothetical protein
VQDTWQFSATPYLWLPALEGDVTVRGVASSPDLGIGDTIDLLTDSLQGAVGIVIGPVVGALFTTAWALWGTAAGEAATVVQATSPRAAGDAG